ncbi:A/G-specific adenine glycosylase [Chroococcidiopsis sp. SAG 2025]|uniref:A/G-specific adenine glycosylase n=1 Tax=Chroococcidiopsis sp. SAG 2025 TaxID=171389 RepID=UPI002936F79C|nr:A/G-specific adenine glycosylase [Chroococcidiopsis sp. SAG 2025]
MKKVLMDRGVRQLLAWYDRDRRLLPWRQQVNIYHTWICEVMSQQTTLAVVLPKFAQFIQQLPTVDDLANCDEETLHQLWAGLGYYARARNLKKGAEFIVNRLNGRFPQSYREWLQIPGCGDYTAAAIASICLNEKVPCIDGNVTRVVSRLLALQDVWSTAGRSHIQNYLTQVIPSDRPGDFNQAMMELGATICRKTKPRCDICPLQMQCLAYANNCIEICPPKKPRRVLVDTELFVLIFWHRQTDTFAIGERTDGFLAKTIGFPLTSAHQLSKLARWQPLQLPGKFTHAIAHHRITGKICVIQLNSNEIDISMRQHLALSKTLHWMNRLDLSAKLSTALDRKAFQLFQNYTYSDSICEQLALNL